MESILYVSVRVPGAGSGRGEIDDIVAVSRSRNLAIGLTGALVATPTHFAQMLEGSRAALAEMMVSIRRDPRHTDILLVALDPKPGRELPRWSLAYSGDSSYVSGLVGAAIADAGPDRTDAFAAIRALMLMFA